MNQRITNISIHAKLYLLGQEIQRAKCEIDTISGSQISLFTLALDEIRHLLPDDALGLINEELDELISVFVAVRLPSREDEREVFCG